MFHTLLANTRIRIASVLAFAWAFYLLFHFSLQALFMPLLAVFTTAAFDLFLTYTRKRMLFFPASSFVTGLLIGLILSPAEQPSTIILAAALAMLSKQFLGAGEHRHVFNPAAFGIVATSMILGVPISWWGVAWSPWVIFIILGACYTLYSLKRLWLPITFLATYSVFLFLTRGGQSLLSSLLDGTVFLFAFIMLPEPITSLAGGKWKYFFGPMIGVLTIAIGKLEVLPDVFLPALLLGNLIGFFAKKLH